MYFGSQNTHRICGLLESSPALLVTVSQSALPPILVLKALRCVTWFPFTSQLRKGVSQRGGRGTLLRGSSNPGCPYLTPDGVLALLVTVPLTISCLLLPPSVFSVPSLLAPEQGKEGILWVCWGDQPLCPVHMEVSPAGVSVMLLSLPRCRNGGFPHMHLTGATQHCCRHTH